MDISNNQLSILGLLLVLFLVSCNRKLFLLVVLGICIYLVSIKQYKVLVLFLTLVYEL